MITRKNYTQIGNYSVERLALDDILQNFNHDVYNKMVDILNSGAIDDFDVASCKEKLIELTRLHFDIQEWSGAACFLALLFNLKTITDQEKFDILENELSKLKIGGSAKKFMEVFESVTKSRINKL